MEIHHRKGSAATIQAAPLVWLRCSGARRTLLLAAGAGALAYLSGYHALLLWQRVASLTLLEPAVALRWVAGLVLLLALVRLRRAGVPLFWGRKALVFWVLVLLLHAAGAAPIPSEVAIELALQPGADLLYILPAALTALALAGLLLAALAPGSRPGLAPSAPRLQLARAAGAARVSRRSLLAPLAPRPPPA